MLSVKFEVFVLSSRIIVIIFKSTVSPNYNSSEGSKPDQSLTEETRDNPPNSNCLRSSHRRTIYA